ncbi:MAG: hypothetical protein KC503_28905 [Myxococcales bacterium]|nr:hypothetical protein [Myxococcales bacterium]
MRTALAIAIASLCLLAACGGDEPTTPTPQRPRVYVDIDRQSCASGCSGAVELELILLTPTSPLPCIIDSKRGPSGTNTTFEGIDLDSGDQIGVGAKLRCQNDSCVRCWARETITVGADATTKLVLKPMALGCQFYGDLVFDNPVIGTCNGK